MDFDKLNADVNCILTKHYTQGRQGAKINKVVVHYNAGNLTVEGCYSVWQSREASAHYQVQSNGRIGQLVWDRDTAWHASNWQANISSIGIEHANIDGGYITEQCLDAGSHLVAAICKAYGLGRPEWLKNVFPHKYFAATSCPGQIYGAQKDAYIQRCQYWYDKMNGGNPSKPSGGSTISSPQPSSNLLEVDGWWGPATTRRAQQLAGTYVDGIISGQYAPDRWRHKGCPSFRYGSGGSTFIKWFQGHVLGTTADGLFGPNSINAFIRRYYSGPDGKIDGPSNSVRGFQRALNQGKF